MTIKRRLLPLSLYDQEFLPDTLISFSPARTTTKRDCNNNDHTHAHAFLAF